MLVVPGIYQNYQHGTVSNQLTEGGRVWGDKWICRVLMCDRRGALYSVHTTAYIVSLHKPAIPLKREVAHKVFIYKEYHSVCPRRN
jgi:hypothetical protein